MKIALRDPMEFLKLMKSSGFTQTKLAVRLGVHRSYIHKIMKGANPGPELAKNVCKVFNKDFDDLFIFASVLTKVI